MKTIAIYHKNCTDGTTAAAVVLKKYPDALLFPLQHGYPPEEIAPILEAASTGDEILTVDCVMGVKEFLALGHKVTSLDHHASAYEEYLKLAKENPAFTYVFDNAKSGASLTWSYLFPQEKMPELVKLVEDRDLWNWKYGTDTKDVTNRVFMHENDPRTMLSVMERPLEEVKKEGAVITAYISALTEDMLESIGELILSAGSYSVPVFNATALKSEIGNELSKRHGGTVGIFAIKGEFVTISFRGEAGKSPSALDVAVALGGGGHREAAGAKMKLEDFMRAVAKK
jgi:uncharacterized protein